MDNRQRIIEDAAEMFRTYGIRAVTMDMLAQQMGISKRTIYENFSDKNELLVGVLQWMAVKQKELTTRAFDESENVIEAIFSLFDRMNEHFMNMSPAFRLDIIKHHNDIIRKLKDKREYQYPPDNSEMLKRGVKEGIFRKELDVEMTNQCLFEVMRMSHDKDSFNLENVNKSDLFRNFYINYLRGISTQKGLDLINFYEKKYNRK
jgi:TetR/AcrR family transcriptional regulator, cholesterol catabolism regulator